MLDKMNTGSHQGWTNYSTHEMYSVMMNNQNMYNKIMELGSSAKNTGQFSDNLESYIINKFNIEMEKGYINWVEIAESIAEEYQFPCCDCKESQEEDQLQADHEKFMEKQRNRKWLFFPKTTTPTKK